MIIMDLTLKNFRAFDSFHINLAYPKKVVRSTIPDEHLSERENFRYKKLNIIIGSNATGKTSLGKILTHIFAFIVRKEYTLLAQDIGDRNKAASFVLDFIPDRTKILYRLSASFDVSANTEFSNEMIHASVKKVDIEKRDNYENCAAKLKAIPEEKKLWNVALEEIPAFAWYLTNVDSVPTMHSPVEADENYLKIFETTLRALDPSITKMTKIAAAEDSYIIKLKNQEVIIQKGRILNPDVLSSGTRSGIDIADMISWLINEWSYFFYCDEKFSYIYSDIEKAFLSVMVNRIPKDGQLFFTTHNLDILDIPFPKHSYCFLKKDIDNKDELISCVYASDYLKRNTDSLRSAVENDLFSAAPSVDFVYELENLNGRGRG